MEPEGSLLFDVASRLPRGSPSHSILWKRTTPPGNSATGLVRTVLKFGVNNFSIKSSLKQATNEGCSVSRFERGPMCDKCVELDKKIERCRRLLSWVPDQITTDRMNALIEELQTQKVELHPEQKS